uniref:Alpha-2-macroglobulin domain-containing protein n=1 Tax=Sparus aurata TaxID=8175 RepID=A0A671V113_SPAAU
MFCMCICFCGCRQYMVAIPAVVEAGAQTRFCVSLLQPSETLVMTVTLISQEKRTVLFEKTTSTEFHTCVQFQAPFVQENEVQNLKVEVQGATFHSEEVRKVMIKIYQPVTFIQTDKPIYLPGQTGNFKLMILPKFDVKINVPDEISLGQDVIKVEVCAKYTYGQPVPGTVDLEMCRPLTHFYGLILDPRTPCFKETKQIWSPFLHGEECSAPEAICILSDTAFCFQQVKAVYFNNTPIPDKLVHLFLHGMFPSRLLQNLTTDSDGIASFSLNTTSFKGNIQLLFAVSVTEGEVSFTLKASPEIAPVVQVVAYTVLPSETVIAHSADFSTEKCFSNKVSLEFSPSSAVPGEETTLQVTAQPDSLCGVSVVDQSVLIKEPGKTLDKDKVTSGTDGLFIILLIVYHVTFIVSSLPLTLVESCPVSSDVHREREVMYMLSSPGGGPPPIVTFRTFFPETWIWNLVEVGESGTKDVSLTVPDTITTWETEAFCLSPQGFGLAPRKHFTVFQPFFLELSLPYSIIRGEHFELKATTFNYLSSCIMVSVTLAPSSDYTITPLSGDQYTSCLCANERKTLSWTMIPSVLGVVNVSVTAEAVASHMSCDNEIVSVPERGRIDVVTRPLIVKAEGTEMTKTYNWLLCPKGEALTEEIELLLPENVIDGSARASLSVLGDILGRALKNLDGLLKMPYGCGEQNMALLAPNIYILQYLKNTQQLTTTIKEKATNFLTSGYQRQLNYKHYDGAYSTFGTGVGNTWLTAFVLRSFVKAQSFVYIDPENIRQTKDWLESKQQENGCFEQSGNLFNNRMKGGVSDEVTLSAYITAAFLEMNMSVTHGAVNRSLSCLNESISDLNNTYTTALLAYVFTLAGDMETRAHLLEQLDKVALNQETSASLSVEISSYVLLAKLSASPTAEDLAYANRIVRWLTGQQNQYGGFSSTQDTVVALQALALYSTLVFSLEGSSTVTVQSSSGQLTFDVNQDNKLLYQEVVLKDVTGKYSLEVKGTACASMQVSSSGHYMSNSALILKFVPVSNVQQLDPTCSNNIILLLCAKNIFLCFYYRYSGKQNSTNMVILDIKMLSGFLTKDIPINHSLQLVQEHSVQNLKPAVVKIYDYYQPSKQILSPAICSTQTHITTQFTQILHSKHGAQSPSTELTIT